MKISRVAFFAVSIAISTGLVLGCQPRRNYGGANQQAESYFLHEIKFPGETMGLIANWYTGSTDNYTVLAAANPSIDLNRMKIGDVIRIPERLLVRREDLPARVVRNAPKPESRSAEPREQPPVVIEEPRGVETPLADQVARESGELIVGGEVVPAALPEPEITVAPEVTPDTSRKDVRIKTRDELLEELLK